jgi:flagellar FliL protein
MSAPAVQEHDQATEKKSLVSKLKIPGIILGIVALEWLMAFFIMPSSAPTPPISPVSAATVDEHGEAADESSDAAVAGDASSHAEETHEEDHGHGKPAKEDHGHGHGKAEKGHGDSHAAAKPAPKHSDADEVDLGNFTVSGFQPASNSTLFITFHLYGTVKHKYVDEFNQRLEENKHRIRDNIIVIIRSAEITDLTDAGLGLIKRRILETTNRSLGKPLLQEVVFSEFSFIEQ